MKKIIIADGSLKGKPAPDMFLRAMKLMKISPDETVIFEDSETGLQAARAAHPGKVYIVNSTGRCYKNWDFEVIDSFKKVNKSMSG